MMPSRSARVSRSEEFWTSERKCSSRSRSTSACALSCRLSDTLSVSMMYWRMTTRSVTAITFQNKNGSSDPVTRSLKEVANAAAPTGT